ncbi:MAG: pyridoxamine 5'-phosphate oxidase [Myxococcales bacterium]|nr:MAG: pyridoxamine 5'-phosphate oxidase [Myxococcales bacterium]
MDDPISRFQERFDEAKLKESGDATAAALATADRAARPSVRIVLLKDFSEKGFVFYTNFGSSKASDLAQNPQAALCFFWPTLAEQVRIEGTVSRVSEAEADAYFKSRPHESQVGAWASKQSRSLDSRTTLESRFDDFKKQFKKGEVPRPEFWGGYCLSPKRIEFWNAGDYRLHDRDHYIKDGDCWKHELLFP